MKTTRRRTLFWAVLACWLAGTHPPVLGASEDGWAGKGELDAPEPFRTRPPGEASRLEAWSRVARRPPVKGTHPIRLPVYGWIRIFQKFVSPVDGASCSYYPSCSTYGLHAIEEYGLLLGIPMATERIMRDHHPENPARYPLYEKGGRFYYWDPVRSRDGGKASPP